MLTCLATPIFRDRGLASLRRADDGSLILDKGLVPSKSRRVRVRVKANNLVTGCSKSTRSTADGEESIETRILQARDTVYEEELFHELVREARIMGSQGVTTRQNLIRFAVSEEQEIMLDLADTDLESFSEDTDMIGSHEDDVLADAIAHATRILLSYAHRQNLHRRTQPPPPLSQKRRHTPEYQLLRPILAYLQHRSHVQWLESFIKDMYGVLKAAGVECDHTANLFSPVNAQRKNHTLPKVEGLVQGFLVPLESTISGSLITPQSPFRVRIRTSLVTPPFGTNYDISMTMPQHPGIQPPARVGLRNEAAAILTHFMMLDVVSAVSSYRPQPAADGHLTWQAAYPHHGELLTVSPTTGEHKKKMKVTLARGEMTLHVSHVRAADGTSTCSQTWKADPIAPQQPGLMEFVADVSKE